MIQKKKSMQTNQTCKNHYQFFYNFKRHYIFIKFYLQLYELMQSNLIKHSKISNPMIQINHWIIKTNQIYHYLLIQINAFLHSKNHLQTKPINQTISNDINSVIQINTNQIYHYSNKRFSTL